MSHPDYKGIGSPETRASEECAELIQALCKASRFGWLNSDPRRPESNNLQDVLAEIKDVREALDSLETHLLQEDKRTREYVAAVKAATEQRAPELGGTLVRPSDIML